MTVGRPPTDYTAFDPVVVDRLLAGRDPGRWPVSPADAGKVVRRMAESGYSDGQIAHRLRMWRRSVIRIRQKLGVAAAMRPGRNPPERRKPAPNRPDLAG
jgi:hypothetical protein